MVSPLQPQTHPCPQPFALPFLLLLDAQVRARTECSLLVLGVNDFNTLLGPLLPALKEQAAKYGAAAPARLRDVSLSSLKEVAVLGAGGFGKVCWSCPWSPYVLLIDQPSLAH